MRVNQATYMENDDSRMLDICPYTMSDSSMSVGTGHCADDSENNNKDFQMMRDMRS